MIAKTIASGAIEGQTDKALTRMGDAAAVAVTKVLAGRSGLSASEYDSVLTVIHTAFAAPQIIEMESDREPRTALFVLEYLKRTAVDGVGARIEEERRFVLDQFAKLKKP